MKYSVIGIPTDPKAPPELIGVYESIDQAFKVRRLRRCDRQYYDVWVHEEECEKEDFSMKVTDITMSTKLLEFCKKPAVLPASVVLPLVRGGIATVGQLLEKSPEEVMDVRMIGRGRLKVIKYFVLDVATVMNRSDVYDKWARPFLDI